MRWDNMLDYEHFVMHMRETSRFYRLRGLAELVLALICLVMFSVFVFLGSVGPVMLLPGIFLFGMFTLIADGVARFRHGQAIKKFE